MNEGPALMSPRGVKRETNPVTSKKINVHATLLYNFKEKTVKCQIFPLDKGIKVAKYEGPNVTGCPSTCTVHQRRNTSNQGLLATFAHQPSDHIRKVSFP